MDERREVRSLADLPMNYQIEFLSDMAPDLPVTPKMLDRVHTWSLDDRPVTLREYIAAQANKETVDKLGIELKADDSVVSADKLDTESLRKVVLAIYEADSVRATFVRGDQEYTHEQQIEDLRKNTGIVSQLIDMHFRSMRLEERMIELGKVVFKEEISLEIPDFQF